MTPSLLCRCCIEDKRAVGSTTVFNTCKDDMSHNILITGGSGYLGGTILARWASSNMTSLGKLFALVRSDEQAQSVQQLYGAAPLSIDFRSADSIKNAIVSSRITIVIFLIDSYYVDTQLALINGLSEVAKLTGLTTHFVHVCLPPNLGRLKHSADSYRYPLDNRGKTIFRTCRCTCGQTFRGYRPQPVRPSKTSESTSQRNADCEFFYYIIHSPALRHFDRQLKPTVRSSRPVSRKTSGHISWLPASFVSRKCHAWSKP
jgi:hypothetical protein